jgi:hypothetical protein
MAKVYIGLMTTMTLRRIKGLCHPKFVENMNKDDDDDVDFVDSATAKVLQSIDPRAFGLDANDKDAYSPLNTWPVVEMAKANALSHPKRQTYASQLMTLDDENKLQIRPIIISMKICE